MGSSKSDSVELEGWALRSVSSAVCREVRELNGKASSAKVVEHRQSYFRYFRILEVTAPQCRAVHAAFRPDNSSLFILTGKQETLRLIASIDPVPFKSADDVQAFAAFADRVTSADGDTGVIVESVSELGKVAKVGKERLADLEAQFKDRIQPPEKFVLPYGFQERFDIVCGGKLIERTRMTASGGIFFRSDEILAEGLA